MLPLGVVLGWLYKVCTDGLSPYLYCLLAHVRSKLFEFGLSHSGQDHASLRIWLAGCVWFATWLILVAVPIWSGACLSPNMVGRMCMVCYLVDISSSTHLVRSMPLSDYGWQDVYGLLPG
jgi:hypothetical protein